MYLPGPEELIFNSLTEVEGQEETVGFVIADDFEQSIIFGGEALFPLTEKSNINATNLYSHSLINSLVSNEEEDYSQWDE